MLQSGAHPPVQPPWLLSEPESLIRVVGSRSGRGGGIKYECVLLIDTMMLSFWHFPPWGCQCHSTAASTTPQLRAHKLGRCFTMSVLPDTRRNGIQNRNLWGSGPPALPPEPLLSLAMFTELIWERCTSTEHLNIPIAPKTWSNM